MILPGCNPILVAVDVDGTRPALRLRIAAPPRRERLADVILHANLLEDHGDLADNSVQID